MVELTTDLSETDISAFDDSAAYCSEKVSEPDAMLLPSAAIPVLVSSSGTYARSHLCVSY